MTAVVEIDARGHRCPTPSLKLARALRDGPPGGLYRLLATDPMARIDVPFLMQDLGGEVVEVIESDGVLAITVRSRAAPEA